MDENGSNPRYITIFPNFWHVECCSMLSIAHLNASSSEWSDVSRLLKFLVPISCIFPLSSFHTHPIPLSWSVEVYEPSTIQMFSKLKACVSSTICVCGGAGIDSFALYHAWHSISAYLTNSRGSLSIPLNSLSFLAFQMYQIIQGYGSLSSCRSKIPFFLEKR